MQIKTILRKGIDHKVYCEDYLYSFQNDNWIIAATFDGCSDGVDSHFASSLSGKILKSLIIKTDILESQITTEDVFELLIYYFLRYLDEIRIQLGLEGKELLSTMILLVYNKKSEVGKIIAMGDGIVVINGEITIIDQNNEPEYPITYAGQVSTSVKDVHNFLTIHKNIWTFRGLKDITISTDGHQQWRHKTDINKKFQEAMDFFIYDTEMNNLEVMLARKYNILKLKGWENHDDLGMIRIINNEEKNTETEATDNGRIYSETEQS